MNWKEIGRSLHSTREDALWLISHASYLLKTAGVLWGVDLRLSKDNHRQADDTLLHDLQGLKVAMVTHLHDDHYDKALIERLAPADIYWIFPYFMPADLQAKWKETLVHCTFLQPGEELSLEGLRVQAFESIHYDYFKGKRCGVEEIGYRVTAGGKVFVFPGDVRNYEKFPDIQKDADEFFAHVWLGREAALSPEKEMVENYCRYFASAGARRIWLGHLNDMDRLDIDRWTEAHAHLVKNGILAYAPETIIEVPEHGKRYLL